MDIPVMLTPLIRDQFFGAKPVTKSNERTK